MPSAEYWDFAGGIVVHNTAGFAALASVLFVEQRQVLENRPPNVPHLAGRSAHAARSNGLIARHQLTHLRRNRCSWR
ncbi:hypothetical protein [Paraburkholderia sp. DGU8]|uniref:hypothetical protein n=1 Tax=Paraburkholderia sp. DGU8 TaxID=3161997 RepID=UPI00346733EB